MKKTIYLLSAFLFFAVSCSSPSEMTEEVADETVEQTTDEAVEQSEEKLPDEGIVENDLGAPENPILSLDEVNKIVTSKNAPNISYELIKESLFQKKQIRSVSYFKEDGAIAKNNGVLELKCEDKNVSFKDNLSSSENYVKYELIGFSEELNQYLMSVTNYENYYNFLVDGKTGAKSANFGDEPIFSPDGSQAIVAYYDNYDDESRVEFYTFDAGKFTLQSSVSYANWTAGELFWNLDGSIYIKAFKSDDMESSIFLPKNDN